MEPTKSLVTKLGEGMDVGAAKEVNATERVRRAYSVVLNIVASDDEG
jgi:hypothetical protein